MLLMSLAGLSAPKPLVRPLRSRVGEGGEGMGEGGGTGGGEGATQ